MTYIFGIVAGVCLVGHALYMPHPILTDGNETVSDIFYILFMVFAGLTLLSHWENK